MTGIFFHRILVEPLVVVVASGRADLWPGVVYASLIADGRPVNVLISMCWLLEKDLPNIRVVMEKARSRFSSMRFTILANTKEDENLARSCGIDSFLCNHNCFLDERLFYPELDISKIYGAVYNGRLDPAKRHELAINTSRLAIITAGSAIDRSYAATVLPAMRDLVFCNYRPDSGVRSNLSVEQVRRILVRSWCGLALSAFEGAMYASGEYLLAGLPVVTTHSRGGRDVFFHPDYVTTVEDDPEAVAEAVLDFKQRRLDPLIIRNRTITLFREHRQRMVAHLSEIAQTDLFPFADASMWLPQFKHQMRTWLKVSLGTAGD